MANAKDGECEACGRELPSTSGRGRRRRYCDATCRSAARRERAPRIPMCELRLGWLRCERESTGYLTVGDHPYSVGVPVCDECRETAQQFAEVCQGEFGVEFETFEERRERLQQAYA